MVPVDAVKLCAAGSIKPLNRQCLDLQHRDNRAIFILKTLPQLMDRQACRRQGCSYPNPVPSLVCERRYSTSTDNLHQGTQQLKRVNSLDTPAQLTNTWRNFHQTSRYTPRPHFSYKQAVVFENERMGKGNYVLHMSGYLQPSSNGQSMYQLFSNPPLCYLVCLRSVLSPFLYIYICLCASYIFYAPLVFSEKTITLTSILSLGRLFGGISLCSKEL